MPLLDHFHPPLSVSRHWESFHAAWAAEIMRTLNREELPQGFFAEAQVHIGGRVQVDVATFEKEPFLEAETNGNSGGVAVEKWAPPTPALVIPAVFPDEIEVQVFGTTGGATLVAAIELISPANKDRWEMRRAFTAKCASYLQLGIGLVIVDIVTERKANLHDDLIEFLQQPRTFSFPPETALYAVAYRPARRTTADQIEIWPNALAVGLELPIVPLALRNAATVRLNLESTYNQVCQDSRL